MKEGFEQLPGSDLGSEVFFDDDPWDMSLSAGYAEGAVGMSVGMDEGERFNGIEDVEGLRYEESDDEWNPQRRISDLRQRTGSLGELPEFDDYPPSQLQAPVSFQERRQALLKEKQKQPQMRQSTGIAEVTPFEGLDGLAMEYEDEVLDMPTVASLEEIIMSKSRGNVNSEEGLVSQIEALQEMLRTKRSQMRLKGQGTVMPAKTRSPIPAPPMPQQQQQQQQRQQQHQLLPQQQSQHQQQLLPQQQPQQQVLQHPQVLPQSPQPPVAQSYPTPTPLYQSQQPSSPQTATYGTPTPSSVQEADRLISMLSVNQAQKPPYKAPPSPLPQAESRAQQVRAKRPPVPSPMSVSAPVSENGVDYKKLYEGEKRKNEEMMRKLQQQESVHLGIEAELLKMLKVNGVNPPSPLRKVLLGEVTPKKELNTTQSTEGSGDASVALEELLEVSTNLTAFLRDARTSPARGAAVSPAAPPVRNVQSPPVKPADRNTASMSPPPAVVALENGKFPPRITVTSPSPPTPSTMWLPNLPVQPSSPENVYMRATEEPKPTSAAARLALLIREQEQNPVVLPFQPYSQSSSGRTSPTLRELRKGTQRHIAQDIAGTIPHTPFVQS